MTVRKLALILVAGLALAGCGGNDGPALSTVENTYKRIQQVPRAQCVKDSAPGGYLCRWSMTGAAGTAKVRTDETGRRMVIIDNCTDCPPPPDWDGVF